MINNKFKENQLGFQFGELIRELTNCLEQLVIVGESNFSEKEKQEILNDLVRFRFKVDSLRIKLKNMDKN